MPPGIVDRFKVIDIDQRESKRLVIVHQRRDIAVEGAAVFTAGKGVDSRLTDVGQFTLFVVSIALLSIASRRGARLTSPVLIALMIFISTVRDMTQIKAEQDDDDALRG